MKLLNCLFVCHGAAGEPDRYSMSAHFQWSNGRRRSAAPSSETEDAVGPFLKPSYLFVKSLDTESENKCYFVCNVV